MDVVVVLVACEILLSSPGTGGTPYSQFPGPSQLTIFMFCKNKEIFKFLGKGLGLGMGMVMELETHSQELSTVIVIVCQRLTYKHPGKICHRRDI